MSEEQSEYDTHRRRCSGCGKSHHNNADIGCTKCDPRARHGGRPGPVPTAHYHKSRDQPGFGSAPWSAVGTDTEDRAHVYAAAAAEKAKNMGYDPRAAVEALPGLIQAASGLLASVKEDCLVRGLDPTNVKGYSHLRDALASAEGSDDE